MLNIHSILILEKTVHHFDPIFWTSQGYLTVIMFLPAAITFIIVTDLPNIQFIVLFNLVWFLSNSTPEKSNVLLSKMLNVSVVQLRHKADQVNEKNERPVR